MSANTVSIADRIRRWREWAGLTQAQLARAVEVSTAAETMWESGKTEPTHSNIAKICSKLGIEQSDFWGKLPRSGSRRSSRAEA